METLDARRTLTRLESAGDSTQISELGAAFGSLLRDFRQGAGLTELGLAQEANFSLDYIGRLERGTRRATPSTVDLLAYALKLTAEQRDMLRVAATRDRPVYVRRKREPWCLPSPSPQLVGRKQEIFEIARLFRIHGAQIVTLLGPPGVGKTRLAIEVGRELTEHFDGHVALVHVTDETSEDRVLARIARAVGITSTRSLRMASIASHLGGSHALLVLDRSRHEAAAVTTVVALTRMCPNLHILMTGWTSGTTSIGTEIHIDPLATPDPGRWYSPSALQQIDSAALFLTCAHLSDPDFSITEENVGAVASICREMDGMPLAIQIVAGWAREGLSSSEAVRRYTEHVNGDESGCLNRQRAPESALDWAFRFLDDELRTICMQVSVFSGRWSLAAAERVCQTPDTDLEDSLRELARRSLITTVAGRRYYMYSTVRAFAKARLIESDQVHECKLRHALYFSELVEEISESLTGEMMRPALDMLEDNHSNVTEALKWCFDNHEHEVGARLAAAMRHFWRLRGHLSEGSYWCELAVAKCPHDGPSRLAATDAAALFAYWLGDTSRWETLSRERLRIARLTGDCEMEQASLLALCWIAASEGKRDVSEQHLRQHAIVGESEDRERAILWHTVTAANLARFAGETARCHELFQEVISRASAAQENTITSVARLHFGLSCLEADLPGEATRNFLELLRGYLQSGESRFVPHALEGLALTEIALDGNAQRVRDLLGTADHLRDVLGCPREPDMTAALLVARPFLDADRVETSDLPTYLCLDEAVAFGLKNA